MIEPAKKIPGQNDPLPPEPKVRTPDDVKAVALAILNGDSFENDMVEYFAGKLRELAREGTKLSEMLEMGRREIARIETRITAIRSQSDGYMHDLVEWNDRAETPE